MDKKPLILIAESGKEFRLSLMDSLKSFKSFDLVEAVNYRDTIKKMIEFRPDVLILSLDMQHKFQLMDFLRNRKSDCYVIVYQEKLQDVSINKYSNYGISEILTRDLVKKQAANILKERFIKSTNIQ